MCFSLPMQPPLHHPLTCAHKVSVLSITEVMEDLVSVGLCHAGVDKEAGVPQLCDLLGQQLHSLHRVAKDDALVDLKLCECGMYVWCVARDL